MKELQYVSYSALIHLNNDIADVFLCTLLCRLKIWL